MPISLREYGAHRARRLKRLLEFSEREKIEVQLADTPPYYRSAGRDKLHPVERRWGVLESHWGGELIDGRIPNGLDKYKRDR